jgi:hypothetical protein
VIPMGVAPKIAELAIEYGAFRSCLTDDWRLLALGSWLLALGSWLLALGSGSGAAGCVPLTCVASDQMSWRSGSVTVSTRKTSPQESTTRRMRRSRRSSSKKRLRKKQQQPLQSRSSEDRTYCGQLHYCPQQTDPSKLSCLVGEVVSRCAWVVGSG